MNETLVAYTIDGTRSPESIRFEVISKFDPALVALIVAFLKPLKLYDND